MKYERAIESVLANPALIEYQDGAWRLGETVETRPLVGIPKEGEHDYPVVYSARDELRPLPYEVCVNTPHELREVVVEYNRMINAAMDPAGRSGTTT